MNFSSLTWADAVTFAQAVFTFLTAAVAFISIGMNRSIKAVDVWLGCQNRYAGIMEKIYRLPYAESTEEVHPGLDMQGLVSESDLFALFNIYWHLIHDEYQYWRDKYISNEMFFRGVDGAFDDFRRNNIYYCRDARGNEAAVSYQDLWYKVRDHWFHSRSFGRFVSEVERQARGREPMLDAEPLMDFKKRRFRRVK